jgi:glycosyltransferase involved in cell wall biosynthesis
MGQIVIVTEPRIVHDKYTGSSESRVRGSAGTAVIQLSLVIPAYNEASRLPSTLDAAWSFLEQREGDFELILVDDGSTDATAAIARQFANQHFSVSVVTIRHAGKAAAVRAGLESASGEFVAFADADLATPLTYLDEFVRIARDDADIVIGSREGAGSRRIGEPWYRHAMGRIFNRLVQTLVLPGIEDTQCGFKLFRADAIERILPLMRLYREANAIAGPRVTAFDVELLTIARKQNLRIEVVPVVWTYGTNSKVNPIRDTLNNAIDILRVRINLSRGRYGS